MMLKIKASAVNNLTDARYFAAQDVHWLGFCMDPSSDIYLSAAEVKAIMEWVEGPIVVAEFGFCDISEIKEAGAYLGIKNIQVNALQSLEDIRELQQHFEVIRTHIPESIAQTEDILNAIKNDNFHIIHLIDFQKNGITWEMLHPNFLNILDGLSTENQIILQIEINPNNIIYMQRLLPNVALSVRGGTEEKVGFKSFDELDELFEALG